MKAWTSVEASGGRLVRLRGRYAVLHGLLQRLAIAHTRGRRVVLLDGRHEKAGGIVGIPQRQPVQLPADFREVVIRQQAGDQVCGNTPGRQVAPQVGVGILASGSR